MRTPSYWTLHPDAAKTKKGGHHVGSDKYVIGKRNPTNVPSNRASITIPDSQKTDRYFRVRIGSDVWGEKTYHVQASTLIQAKQRARIHHLKTHSVARVLSCQSISKSQY